MIMVFGIFIIGLFIVLLEVPGLLKRRLWGELLTFCVLLVGGLALAAYLTL